MSEHGQSLVEFTFAMSVLMLLIMGILWIGLGWSKRMLIHYAAFRAARQQAISHGLKLPASRKLQHRLRAHQFCKRITTGHSKPLPHTVQARSRCIAKLGSLTWDIEEKAWSNLEAAQ